MLTGNTDRERGRHAVCATLLHGHEVHEEGDKTLMPLLLLVLGNWVEYVMPQRHWKIESICLSLDRTCA